MAAPTNPKIEELKARVRVDPKSRHFYPLAEELRRAGRFEEAEQVLREGLAFHPTYLSAWIVLGRVLKETGKLDASRDALAHALSLDGGNVVAARLAADVYMLLGEKVEAIKKYKLVHALMPGDEEVDGIIEGLERELRPPAPAPAEPEPQEREDAAPRETEVESESIASPASAPFEEPPSADVFAESAPSPTSDADTPAAAVAESAESEAGAPFENAFEGSTAVEQAGAILQPTTPAGSVFEESPAAEPEQEWEPSEESTPPVLEEGGGEVIATVTMGDLYLSQGHPEAAEEIFRKVLEREPDNDVAREKLAQLTEDEPITDPRQRKIATLRVWLQKVSAQ